MGNSRYITREHSAFNMSHLYLINTMRHHLITLVILAILSTLIGCMSGPQVATGNSVFMPAANHEAVWEKTVSMLHYYNFEIARENKLDGIIETEYKIGSGCLEPWHHESVGFDNRLESSMQSIRRRVFVSVTPAEGGYVIGVEAFKELEDLPGIAANSAGGATFQEYRPLQRDLNLVVGQSTPSGWINKGRDSNLEADMVKHLQKRSWLH